MLIAHSHLLASSPRLVGSALLIDLVFSAAFCQWLLGVRFGGLPAWTVIPVAAVGLALSRWSLPADVSASGALALLTVAVVEGAALVLLCVRAAALARAFRAARAQGAERLDAVEQALSAMTPFAPGAARWARLEIEVWYLAVCGPFLRPRAYADGAAFTHHREAGWSAIAIVLGLLVLAEGAAAHVWLKGAGHPVAMWIAFGVHVYTLAWISADARALSLYRTALVSSGPSRGAALEVRVGLRARAVIPLSRLVAAQLGDWEVAGPGQVLVTVSGPANVKLELSAPVELRRALGAPVTVDTVLLQVDDGRAFVRALEAARARSASSALRST